MGIMPSKASGIVKIIISLSIFEQWSVVKEGCRFAFNFHIN